MNSDPVSAYEPTPEARIALARGLADSQPLLAIEELELAWDQARRLGSVRLRSQCCQQLAAIYRQLDNPHLAARYLQHALRAEMELAEDDPQGGVSVQSLIGLAACWSGTDPAGAQELLRVATARDPETHQHATIASHRGVMAAREGRLDEAIAEWSQAQRLFRAAGDTLGTAHTLVNLGHVLVCQRRYDMARRAFALAGVLFHDQGSVAEADAAKRFAREAAAHERLRRCDPRWN